VEPDHVAVFTTGSASEKTSQPPSTDAKEVDLEALMPTEFAAVSALVESIGLFPLQNHGPPPGSALSRLLRSTVLLV
jgi:hypothetical protein